jgi:hypothetical protein
MIKDDLPLTIYQLALLQAYLYEVFGGGKVCEKDYKFTRWYLKEKHPGIDIEQIIEKFKKNKLNCDCDILKKLDLQKMYAESLTFHK